MVYQKITKEEPIIIIGIGCRTTNRENKSKEDIGALWNIFMKENIKEKIPHRLSDDIYSVYGDYENQDSRNIGDYTTVLGFPCSIKGLEAMDEHMSSAVVPVGNYYLFPITGEGPTAVGEKWGEIWQLSAAEKDFESARTYTVDFDYYPAHGTREIYIGVR